MTEQNPSRHAGISRVASILNAQSIAIVGASSDPAKITGRPLAYMLSRGYQGKLYPVNPGRSEVQGLTSYPSLKAIGQRVDLAIIGTEAGKVESVITEGIAAGIPAFVVFSSGFSEAGEEGKAMQARLRTLAQEKRVAILGPNCLGAANCSTGLIASFTTALEETPLQRGRFAFVSQSGALGAYWLDMVLRSGLGFSHWITTGNECDVDAAEAIDFLVDDPDTAVIGMYLEDIRDTVAFRRALLRAAQARKPVIAIKSGRSKAGAAAAASHTGAIAGDDTLYDACFRQGGAVRVDSLSALVDTARLFLYESVPDGDRLAVMSVSGGAGVLIADEAEALGMQLPAFSSATKAALETILPAFATPSNPLDLTGNVVQSTDSFGRALSAVGQDADIDSVVLFVGMMHSIADTFTEALASARKQLNRPIAVVWLSAMPETVARLEAERIPVFADIPQCMQALDAARKARRLQSEAASAALPSSRVAEALSTTTTVALSEYSGKELLRSQQAIAIPEGRLIRSGESSDSLPLTGRLAAKLQSSELLHKSEAGGVILGIRTADELAGAVQTLRAIGDRLEIDVEGVLVEQMVPFDHELLLGLRRDPRFGAVLTIARGGVEVELDADAITRLLPLDAGQVESMLRSLRAARLLDGFRGRPKVDIPAIAARIAALCDWFTGQSELAEVEINPLAVRADQAWALDALVTRTA